MRIHSLDTGIFTITVPEDWTEITSTLETEEAPFTIADPENGVGAMQFSIAQYKSGMSPNVTMDDLVDLLKYFSTTNGLGPSFDSQMQKSKTCTVGQSFHSGDDFVRVWYATDEKSVLLVTYVCDWEDKDVEAAERDAVASSISFK